MLTSDGLHDVLHNLIVFDDPLTVTDDATEHWVNGTTKLAAAAGEVDQQSIVLECR